MAVDNKNEEDYLDSLLKSVLGEDSKQSDEELNDEDLLDNIEDDLFSKGIEDEDLSDEEMRNLIFSEDIGGKTREQKNQRKAKKEKKKRWGSKKKPEQLQTASGIDSLTESTTPPEGFEDLFNDQPESVDETSSTLDEDMNGLYDILGMSAEEGLEEDNSNAEIEKLEEEKPSKRRKKKKEKTKFKLLGKKNSSNEEKPAVVSSNQEETLETPDDFGFSFMPEEGEMSSENTESLIDGDFGFGGLGDIFMGGEERDEDIDRSDENARLMDEMDNGNYDEDEILEKPEEPKKKKEKKKKEKKLKVKKEKKEKKEKKPREPKVRRPKEPDVIIHISKGFVIFSASLIILIVVSLILGGNYNNYKKRTDEAVNYYLNQDYDAAYRELSGLKMHKDDQFFYDKIETIMYVQRHYTSYKGLYKIGEYDDALNTLLRGIKMYDKYKEQARKLDCFEDFTTVLGWIDGALLEKYGITESQAREITLIESRSQYAQKVYELADAAEKREAEAAGKEAENNGDKATE